MNQPPYSLIKKTHGRVAAERYRVSEGSQQGVNTSNPGLEAR